MVYMQSSLKPQTRKRVKPKDGVQVAGKSPRMQHQRVAHAPSSPGEGPRRQEVRGLLEGSLDFVRR